MDNDTERRFRIIEERLARLQRDLGAVGGVMRPSKLSASAERLATINEQATRLQRDVGRLIEQADCGCLLEQGCCHERGCCTQQGCCQRSRIVFEEEWDDLVSLSDRLDVPIGELIQRIKTLDPELLGARK